ncbi:MAG: SPFH domain-containing protein [Planctomycetota bacterium]|nr:MAG: SPFH domain-containing protein [Planctomycetota bacterium]
MLRLEVIDYVDPTGNTLAARVPEFGTAAIQYGAQLIVQQNQEAVFFRDGRAMDSFGPGRYTLTTANIPILSKLLTIPWEKSPFQACVYFVGKQRFIDQGWGTRTPITMRDPDFGIVRLRGFGKYSFRVTDAPLFINEVVGTQGKVTTSEINNYLRDLVVSGLTDLLATANIGLLQMAAKFDELSSAARAKMAEHFQKLGLELTDFVINSISPPEEVQKAIDARSSMAAIGDLQSYTMYQAAQGIGNLGQGSGEAGSAAAMGLGAGFGMMLPQMLQQAMQARPANAPGGATAAGASASGSATPPAGTVDFSQLTGADAPGGVQATLRQLATANGWKIQPHDSTWQITVPIGTLRKQHVWVDFSKQDEAGHPLVAIWSSCGAADPRQALTLLRYNAQLIHGAFAVVRDGDADRLVLRANLLADTADPLELLRTVTAIAWQADRYEEQVLGTDQA